MGCIHWVYEVLVLLAYWRAGEFNELACSLQGATLYQQSTNTICFAATCTRYTSLKGHGRPKALLLRVGEERMPKLVFHEAPISPCKPRSVPILPIPPALSPLDIPICVVKTKRSQREMMAIRGYLQGLAFLARGKTWADPLAEDRAGESRISGGSPLSHAHYLNISQFQTLSLNSSPL